MANDKALRTYDPKAVSITFKTVIFTGFADGDFVSVSSDDYFTARMGADGSEDRVNMNTTSKDVEITLMATSITNDLLDEIFKEDINGNTGYGPLTIKDNNGTFFLFSEQAYIKKAPDKTMGNSLGTIVWSFRCPQAEYIPGSNL